MNQSHNQTAVAYLTRHDDEVTVHVYQDGGRLARLVVPAGAFMSGEQCQVVARMWLQGQGFTLTSEFVNAPFATTELFDYRATLAW